ncbi:MAG: BlaI/MecI/CopY family transcriptional regulator [Deltaproteobacteria bacterium]|nr:BlaI/MecI/CopY family transcriptional regulator [Deltaproteobacteria bacterium]MBW2534932.1 BlaI/MecI/CopY family transcriptional regulator [Deltaproteobacteria bacterium]
MADDRHPTDAELEILRRLWRRGTATVRELRDDLYPAGGHAHHTTVQSLLARLEDKGCVRREKDGRVNLYSATVSRGDLVLRRLRDTADALCDGSLAPLLTHLVQDVDLEEDEARALESLVERLDREREATP